MKHLIYRYIGIIYIILAFPPMVYITGNWSKSESIDFFTVALGGLPLGLLLVLFSTKKFHINHLSNMGLHFAIIALFCNLPLFISYALVRRGLVEYENVIIACALAIILFALASFFSLIMGLIHRKPNQLQLKKIR